MVHRRFFVGQGSQLSLTQGRNTLQDLSVVSLRLSLEGGKSEACREEPHELSTSFAGLMRIFLKAVWWTCPLSLIDFQVLPGYHEPQDQERGGGFHADAHADAPRTGDRDRP
jgi:hypothetical protein